MAAATRTRSKRGTGPKVDPYKVVTDRIVEALEAGVVPWHRPWKSWSNGPTSLSTRRPYQGVNVFILGATAMMRGYDSKWWGTYKQIAERGGQVRKGEKGTPIVFWRFFETKDKTTGEDKRIPVLRYYSVFNADQCDDLTVPASDELPEVAPIDECERISEGYLSRSGPKLKHGGDQAYFSPMFDTVQMPLMGQFESVEHYYGALFHEYGHSTGVEARLNRKDFSSGRFGDADYSREELVAEMCAAFVCGEAGIDVNVPHRAGYIQSWLQALSGDVKLVVQAAGQAQKAANLILDRKPPVEGNGTEENGNG